MPVPPIIMQVSREELDLGTPKFNDVAKSIGHITIEFSHMRISKVYAMKNLAVVEMKIREGALIKQVKVANKSVDKMKQVEQ